MNRKQFQIREEYALGMDESFGNDRKVMVMILTPELCRCQRLLRSASGSRGFSHASDKTRTLVFPDHSEVRGIFRDLVATTIGDGKRPCLIGLDLIIILEQIDIGPLQ